MTALAAKSVRPRSGVDGDDFFYGRLLGPLPQSQTIELIAAAQAGDVAARHKVETHNLRLVYRTAEGYRGNSVVGFTDLIQCGYLGLKRAVELFDPTKNFKFSTYACVWIRAEIQMALKTQIPTVAMSCWVWGQARKFDRNRARLTAELGYVPSDLEVAADLGELPSQAPILRSFRAALAPTVSTRITKTEGLDLADRASGADPSSWIQASVLLDRLPGRLREMVCLRFFQGMKYRQLGEVYGFSRTTANTLVNQALAQLKEFAAEEGFDEGLPAT